MRQILIAVATIGLAAAGVRVIAQQQSGFPHDRHTNLFPSCLGCHGGVPTGTANAFYPEAELCARCHDGTQQPRVSWRAATTRVTNLVFSHPGHDAREAMDCGACHTVPGAQRMQVQRLLAGNCLGCHAHQAHDHYTDATCTTCHTPLAVTGFTAQRVSALPRPADHERADFLGATHGQLAASESSRCATCHARELCAACHVNVATLRAASSIPAAQPSLSLPRFSSRYFEPASHRDPRWIERHRQAGDNIASCTTCHTRQSCLTCHRTAPPAILSSMPSADSVTAPGVPTVLTMPASHQEPLFDRRHGTRAAANARNCATCHARIFCETCHTSVRSQSQRPEPIQARQQQSPPAARGNRPAYHLPDFMARHATAAYGRNLECANCHNTTVFCRDCHEQAGMGSRGRLQAGFHDAEPLWLLRHGQGARQGLESCASCHKQRDCTQCHSQVGAFQVNPHGKDFDAAAAHARNSRVCLVCHLSDPIRR